MNDRLAICRQADCGHAGWEDGLNHHGDHIMSGFTKEQLHALETALRRQEGELREALRDEAAYFSAEHRAELIDATGDGGDTALAATLGELETTTVTRQIGELCDVEAARKRIADSTYGVCIDCGESIGFLRLAAYPVAKPCALCQGRHERKLAYPRLPRM
jgi:RNA polymerase-binding transcription factor DksA